MKRIEKLVKAIHVETPVLNAVFIGYFVLLIASVMLVTKHRGDNGSSEMTASKEVQTSYQLKN